MTGEFTGRHMAAAIGREPDRVLRFAGTGERGVR